MFDFIVTHKSRKINFINALFKRSNYKSENKLINKFLFIL